MAESSADFTLRLRNQVTGPAKAMSRSIRGLSADLRDKQKFFARGEDEFAKKLKASRRAADITHRQDLRAMAQRRAAQAKSSAAAARMAQQRDVGFQRGVVRHQLAVKRARAEAMRLEGGGGGGASMLAAGGFGGAALAGVAALTAAATAAAAAVSMIAVKFGAATLEAVNFGQRSKTALTSILKDAPLAAQQFNQVRGEAGKLGLNVFDTVDSFKMLANAGFAVPMARDLVRLSADLQALTGSTESAQFALRAISQIKMKGRLQAEEITGQLAEHGVSADAVYAELGKTLGKTRKEILSMQKAGELSADVAIPAIIAAVSQRQLGQERAGQFAGKMNAASIGGMWNRLKAQVQNAFISLGERVEPGVTNAFQSIMGSIQKAVASPQVAALGNALVGLFNRVSDLAGSVDFAGLLTRAAETLGTELTAAATFIQNNGTALRENFERFVDSMIVGMKLAADLMKPLLALASSDFAKFLFTPIDQTNDELFAKFPGQKPQPAPASLGARAAGSVGGNKNIDQKFDIVVNLNGTDAKPENVGNAVKSSIEREAMAMLQDF
jgi:tape measure domain-containing protein